MVPNLVGDIASLLDALGRIIAVAPADRARVIAAVEKHNWRTPVLVRGGLDWPEFCRVNLLAPSLPGLEAEIGWKRRYSCGEASGHVVGYVGRPDRHDVEADPVLAALGVRIGKSGIELGLEHALRGTPGWVKREVDARGRVLREVERVAGTAGTDVGLTIDAALQERVLARMRQEDFSALVALDVANGEIAAMGSTPAYDPAVIADGLSTETWEAMVGAEGEPLSNKAIRGQYPPGSTFKIVTALAGLESGAITPETEFVCKGALDYAGHSFGCWNRSGHGTCRLGEAVKVSCDVFFYETARRVGIDRIAEVARRLGLGQLHACGLGAQKPGLVPDPTWKMSALDRPWVGGETLLAGIGQGYVLATALQLAVMTARVASGRRIAPTLIRGRTGPAPPPPLIAEPTQLAVLQAALHDAVNAAGGTGASAALALPGLTMAGKTGTAQVTRASRGRRSEDLARSSRDHSLFVGYAPYESPRFAIAAIVEHGGGGSKAAAPLARDVMQMLLEREAPPATSQLSDADRGLP